jgi:hypothetical protein
LAPAKPNKSSRTKEKSSQPVRGGGGVPQVVEADFGQVGPLQQAIEDLSMEVAAAQWATARIAEDPLDLPGPFRSHCLTMAV